VRWAVVQVPALTAGLLGAWWLSGIWWIVVYVPIPFTRLHQGLHDRGSGTLVIKSRHLPERWAFANSFFARVRR
jgi:hypothetical protein